MLPGAEGQPERSQPICHQARSRLLGCGIEMFLTGNVSHVCLKHPARTPDAGSAPESVFGVLPTAGR
jgi:hypothetical protein